MGGGAGAVGAGGTPGTGGGGGGGTLLVLGCGGFCLFSSRIKPDT